MVGRDRLEVTAFWIPGSTPIRLWTTVRTGLTCVPTRNRLQQAARTGRSILGSRDLLPDPQELRLVRMSVRHIARTPGFRRRARSAVRPYPRRRYTERAEAGGQSRPRSPVFARHGRRGSSTYRTNGKSTPSLASTCAESITRRSTRRVSWDGGWDSSRFAPVTSRLLGSNSARKPVCTSRPPARGNQAVDPLPSSLCGITSRQRSAPLTALEAVPALIGDACVAPHVCQSD